MWNSKRIRMMLSIMGFITFTVGWLILAFASVHMRTFIDSSHTLDAAVYVSSQSCLTCHADHTGAWSDAVHPLPIQNAVLNPHSVMATNLSSYGLDESANRSTNHAVSAWNSGWNSAQIHDKTSERQQYIVQTEAGIWVEAIPWELRLSPVIHEYVPPEVLQTNCALCHSEAYIPSQIGVRLQAEFGSENVFVDNDLGIRFDWSDLPY